MVTQATSEFIDFDIIWWQELANLHRQPDSWDKLKEAMCDLIPPYKHDLCKKLLRLEQGDMFIHKYYAELQKGMIRKTLLWN